MKHKVSEAGYSITKKFEGCHLTAYNGRADKKGVWTIGYGHRRTAKEGMIITQEEAEELLRQDMENVEAQLNSLNLNINQNQFDALANLIFNIGIGEFLVSTVLRLIRRDPKDLSIAAAFQLFIKSGRPKKSRRGLLRRRLAESLMYFSW